MWFSTADPLKLNFDKGSCINIYFMKMYAYRLDPKSTCLPSCFYSN